MGKTKEQKVADCEYFLNDVLKADLSLLYIERDKFVDELSEYEQLRSSIETLKRAQLDKDGLKTQMDVGCHFYMQANVPDPSKLIVNIGAGCFLELTLDDSLIFVEAKTNNLKSSIEKLTKQTNEVKAKIKLVLQGLQEIQGIK